MTRYAEFSDLDRLLSCLRDLGATRVVVKPLAENDNSKQQIYLGGSLSALDLIPFGAVSEQRRGTVPTLHAQLTFAWVTPDGTAAPAKHAKLIVYPSYPEVRLSGFLLGSRGAPSEYMQPVRKELRRQNNAPDGRMLIMGVTDDRRILAYLAPHRSVIARELAARISTDTFERSGVFWHGGLALNYGLTARPELLARLREIKAEGWQHSRRLKGGVVIRYEAENGVGYTLEALFGVSPNGDNLPDFKGWELKACSQSVVTLMTPEPTSGVYVTEGKAKFLRNYAHLTPAGALYFTGRHRVAETCGDTKQTLVLNGYVRGETKFETLGSLDLVDPDGIIAASWSFAKLLERWGRKHALAAYVPAISRKGPPREYRYADEPVLLGLGTSFPKFLNGLATGSVYYDPGVRLDDPTATKSKIKARSQFRVKKSEIGRLYDRLDAVDV